LALPQEQPLAALVHRLARPSKVGSYGRLAGLELPELKARGLEFTKSGDVLSRLIGGPEVWRLRAIEVRPEEAMAQVKVSDATVERYKKVREALRKRLGTSRVTQTLCKMSDEDMHGFANELLELFDTCDPVFGA
jgi:hypothetical protein